MLIQIQSCSESGHDSGGLGHRPFIWLETRPCRHRSVVVIHHFALSNPFHSVHPNPGLRWLHSSCMCYFATAEEFVAHSPFFNSELSYSRIKPTRKHMRVPLSSPARPRDRYGLSLLSHAKTTAAHYTAKVSRSLSGNRTGLQSGVTCSSPSPKGSPSSSSHSCSGTDPALCLPWNTRHSSSSFASW